MATQQTDLDRVGIAWSRAVELVNAKLPDYVKRIQAARARVSAAGSVIVQK